MQMYLVKHSKLEIWSQFGPIKLTKFGIIHCYFQYNAEILHMLLDANAT